MAFSCELLCRACMEPFSGNSMPLVNKKKKRKTPICGNFEELTMLKVKENDQLPQQLCLGCVSELNKCFAFREKCVRTNQTLRTYLDLSDDEDESEVEQQRYVFRSPTKKQVSAEARGSKEERYEQFEIVHEMDVEKSQTEAEDVVLEMAEMSNVLNPTSSTKSGKLEELGDNEFVYIIQSVDDNPESAQLVQTSQLKDEKSPNETNKDSFKCTTCEMVFVRKKNFDNHMKRFHENDDEVAPEKKRLRLKLTQESNKEELKKNLEENPEAKRCKTCGALYMNEKSLKLHERRNACKQESYQCDVCNKVFTDQKVFTEHTENHPQQQQPEEPFDPDRKFQCTICPRAFKMLSTLKDHTRTHTGDKPFVCTICGRGFSQNTNLKQHLRRHTQVKPFKCDHKNCTAAFVSKGELDSHSRVHTGAHPFSCDQCGTGFTTSSSLLKHKRIHSGEKPYQCDFCPQRFTALGTLRNHTRTHTGEKPHKCRHCNRAFTQKSDMSAHERTHTGDRPFVCKICKSAFHQSGTLKTHMKIHSKPEEEEEREEEADDD